MTPPNVPTSISPPRDLALATLSALRHAVSSPVFFRGVLLCHEGAVERATEAHPVAAAHAFRGTVKGTTRYDVAALAEEDGRCSASCTCPFAAQHPGRCKHVVAFLLALVQRGLWKASGLPRIGERTGAKEASSSLAQIAPGPSAIGTLLPAARVINSAWRVGADRTVAADPTCEWTEEVAAEASGPLVYGVALRDQALREITCFARYAVGGSVELGAISASEARRLALDAIDERATRDLAPSASSRSDARWFLWAAIPDGLIQTGRVHRLLGPRELGPPLRWIDPKGWSFEERIELSTSSSGAIEGASRWARLVHEIEPAIDLVTKPDAIVRGVTIVGDVAFAMSALLPPRWEGDAPRGDPIGPIIAQGRSIVGGAELPSFIKSLRSMEDRFPESGWHPAYGRRSSEELKVYPRRSKLLLDPRIGIRFFNAEPQPVFRMETGEMRKTVDLRVLARYVDPEDPNLRVDRCPSQHAVIDRESDAALVVPRGNVAREREIVRRAAEIIEACDGSSGRKPRVWREHLPEFLDAAAKAGFAVELARERVRATTTWSIGVTSGIDWFELDGSASTTEGLVPLRELVNAARKHPDAIEILPLADGSRVMMPRELSGTVHRLARMLKRREDESLRFGRSDALLLDAMLEAAPHRKAAPAFSALCERLKSLAIPTPARPSASFVGELRPYQQEGVGWMKALREAGVSGCLADEMGLGKTVQVLAMLEDRRSELATRAGSRGAPRAERGGHRRRGRPPEHSARAAISRDAAGSAPPCDRACPSLLVVPRSIVRNWIDEGKRFAPSLRMRDFSHVGRSRDVSAFDGCDVAVVTYGTLLRDIHRLSSVQFDYVILDEAQAIKTGTSRTAKSAKCLQARHRLALTGTPIENHLGELWSLVDFLNPSLAERCMGLAAARAPGDLSLVRRTVAPILLRRTKSHVASDLPERIEQTVFCDMTEGQKEHYDAILDRVRAELFGKVDQLGLNRARLVILEGLLRLRQVACHPLLADRRRAGAGSGKLEALLEMLEDAVVEERKTLVFSQFTSFLELVQRELATRGIRFEYLDGQTRDRAARVKRFSDDAGCQIFLLSLKAGGTGLNLQAAERVILLDPWWNPAVEAQAIDRAHRIGQRRTVHAVRLIAAGSVEERVLQLQQRKRAVAAAVLDGETDTSETGPLAALSRDDLETLLAKRPARGSSDDRHCAGPAPSKEVTRSMGVREKRRTARRRPFT